MEINQKDKEGSRHGYWLMNHPSGNLWFKGDYIHGKAFGYWEVYYESGKLFYRGHYMDNERRGYWESAIFGETENTIEYYI